MVDNSAMRTAVQSPRLLVLAIGALALLGAVFSYLLFGSSVEAQVTDAMALAESQPYVGAALVIAALAADIVLPVPSTIIGAFSGAVLGIAGGTLATWAGLMLGCVLGYWLGRAIVTPLPDGARPGPEPHAPRRASHLGPVMLAATRAVPVLAETTIITAGAARMDFGQFLLVTVPANLLVAFAYAGMGSLLAGIDPALAAIAATCLCALAWGIGPLMRGRRPSG